MKIHTLPSSGRAGTSAIEVALAAALLVVCLVPVMGLLQTSHHVATVDELQLLARGEARRAEARLRGMGYAALLAGAIGEPPPAELDARLSPESLALPLLELPGTLVGDDLDRRLSSYEVVPYVEELEPGLARVATLVRWVDPARGRPRHLVRVAFLEDPEVAAHRTEGML